ncbi:SDR family oxidoreductase [Chryseobacterium salivictor]|uniref:UDP-N-acetylglucosamine 4-epimerase n=1 Tax=Chryseobacterium salivictor TaxID=2547600 RepID=A0A4P6ZIV5_9FLAO|nr:SDR family oxidoreductase [Chryseobacterium salivictor]QBO59669.1 UDP-N-acetylglucosamine 4-epimerase [Chryseobacterium salivictor]
MLDFKNLKDKKVLVTGGAGFIGSNLCDALLHHGALVTCLDNFATGKRENIEPFLSDGKFTLIEGDIRDLDTCHKACATQDFVLHHAALGSVPRSINDPITSNEVNVGGFLKMLVAAKDAGIQRFVYAASSSTYGDSESLPKVEDIIGKPLSPYAITKYVDELYADVFKRTYDFDTIGLRYFNVFGRRQDPNGAYAAVIPKFVTQFMAHESPTINGEGEYSRDFTYIDNVVLMNLLALTSENPEAQNQVYNSAFGERTTLNDLVKYLKEYLAEFDPKIADIEVKYGDYRKGDVPHSLASIDKAKNLLNYNPQFSMKDGLKEAVTWYWNHLKQKDEV